MSDPSKATSGDPSWHFVSARRRAVLAASMQAMAPALDRLADTYRLRDAEAVMGLCGDLVRAWAATRAELDAMARQAGVADGRDT